MINTMLIDFRYALLNTSLGLIAFFNNLLLICMRKILGLISVDTTSHNFMQNCTKGLWTQCPAVNLVQQMWVAISSYHLYLLVVLEI